MMGWDHSPGYSFGFTNGLVDIRSGIELNSLGFLSDQLDNPLVKQSVLVYFIHLYQFKNNWILITLLILTSACT